MNTQTSTEADFDIVTYRPHPHPHPHTVTSTLVIITIIMYIYHALINVLNAHIIHIDLTTIFYTHLEQSPTSAVYLKYYWKRTNPNLFFFLFSFIFLAN